uniref:Uncharacterized protein n=1 Tax=Romanomermis culicivorax TaxID=13658 RepID=A0A915K0I5_ROMCU
MQQNPKLQTTRCHEQRAEQKEQQTSSQTSLTTGATAQPKVMLTKSSSTKTKSAQPTALPQQMLRAHHSDNHGSHHEPHEHDNSHRQERDHSGHQDNTTGDSRDQDHCNNDPHHPTQSEQSQQPKLVITTNPVLCAIPRAGKNLQFTLQLPSETTTLPN